MSRFAHLEVGELEALLRHPHIGERAKKEIRAELRSDGEPKEPGARGKPRGPLEKDVRRDIIQWAKAAGAVRVVDAEQGWRPDNCQACGASLGKGARTRIDKGFPDLIVFWPAPAACWWVEVKRLGADTTPDQDAFHASLRRAGQVVFVARGVEDCVEWMERLAA